MSSPASVQQMWLHHQAIGRESPRVFFTTGGESPTLLSWCSPPLFTCTSSVTCVSSSLHGESSTMFSGYSTTVFTCTSTTNYISSSLHGGNLQTLFIVFPHYHHHYHCVYLHPFNQLQFFTTTFLITVFTELSLPLCSLASLQQNASFHHYMVKISNIVHWILSTTVFSNTSAANYIISSLCGEVGWDLQHCSLDSLHQCVQQHHFSKLCHVIIAWGESPVLHTEFSLLFCLPASLQQIRSLHCIMEKICSLLSIV